MDVSTSEHVVVCPTCDQTHCREAIWAEPSTLEATLLRPAGGAAYRRTDTEFVAISVIRDYRGLLYAVYAVAALFLSIHIKEYLDGLPLFVAGLLAAALAVLSLCGKVVLIRDGVRATVFTGVGPIGWQKCFDWPSLQLVTEVQAHFGRWRGHRYRAVELGLSRGVLRFGALLSAERRCFLMAAIEAEMMRSRNNSWQPRVH